MAHLSETGQMSNRRVLAARDNPEREITTFSFHDGRDASGRKNGADDRAWFGLFGSELTSLVSY
jgi:hypothetical protein